MSKVIPPSPSARFVIPDDKFEITKLTAYIKPVQDGDGEPSSENIRPIKGWDKVTVFNDTIYDRPILYNQKFTTDGSTSSGGGVTYTNEGNGYWRLTNNGTGTNRKQITGATGESIYVTPVNHIVYACSNAGIDGSTSTFQLYFSYSGGNSQTSNAKEGTLLRRTGTTGIGQYSIRTYSSFRPPEGGLLMRPVCYDLTQMFGEDVAEQILAMETAHAGDGIAWFKNLLPDDYYPPKINNGTEFTCISKIRELPYKEFEVTLPSTVYGGNIDLVSGVLTVDRGYIASYDGETLPSTWISDRDVYAEGTTPTTGAQVVYTLAEPVIYNLTPVEVDYFVGINQLFATSGNISLEYLKDTRKRIKLNGVDMTDYFTPRGMKVSYVKVQGENGGTYLSGDREEDVLAWKAAVTLTCMPLTPEQQSEILIKATSENPSLGDASSDSLDR